MTNSPRNTVAHCQGRTTKPQGRPLGPCVLAHEAWLVLWGCRAADTRHLDPAGGACRQREHVKPLRVLAWLQEQPGRTCEVARKPRDRKGTYLGAGRGDQIESWRRSQRSRGRAHGRCDDSVWRTQGIEGGPHRTQGPGGTHWGVRVAGVAVHWLPCGQGCRWAHGRGAGVAGGACKEKSIDEGRLGGHRDGLCEDRGPRLCPAPLPSCSHPTQAGRVKASEEQTGRSLLSDRTRIDVSAICCPPGTYLGLGHINSQGHEGHSP